MRVAVVAFLSISALGYAQSVISAHSGVVQYSEGDVTIDGHAIHPKITEFPDLKPDQVIATDEGRVELLLTPGVFLRLAENSSVRMISNALSDTRLSVVSGSALIEIAELLPNNSITFEAAGTRITLPRKGLYRIDADPARLRVYDGQARVGLETAPVTVRKGHDIALDSSTLAATSFDAKDIDGFYRWSARRSEYVAAANLTSARVANNPLSSGYTSGIGSSNGRWSWNPWFGMFTYMPGSGMYASPFGSTFYSSGAAMGLFAPRPLMMVEMPVGRSFSSPHAPAVFAGPSGHSAVGPGVSGVRRR